ncbi:ribulose-phosphate 3-epimerase [[Clostridium] innocuum]|uniref:ribulose-phosphate 3-epimerase n=1 Tax=Clostridium innocuum TaxID=1522 RepID=UPI001EDFA993|nr:ribulose-phosphate 3-epimerase [[Clostridium] innocuum]MCG4660743.1 ribulose-phosphate 3-epimerase [[Clostridium] innocuum]
MIIAPSLLNSNIYDIQDTVKIVKNAGDNYLHIDVMDGNFVKMQAFGGKIVTDLKKKTDLVLDVHLMINNPELHIEEYKDADIITVHEESTNQLYSCLNKIKKLGIKAGVAINPGTPVNTLTEVLDIVDQVLVMTVNPAMLGEKFIKNTVKKIMKLKEIKENNHYFFDIEVDGNINDETIIPCYTSGANIFVSGGYIFGHTNPKQRIERLKNVLGNGKIE